ncbi:MAG: DUF1573 domain-containing protein [Bacteroidetes bacterium]|nr:DUF1573 domain-containing protein [Bacteroidota bacterium]
MISVFTYLLAIMTCAPSAQTDKAILEEPKEIEWKKTTHDFGEIIEGTKAKYTFTFVNKGTAPIIINTATASCGCTVPSFSKEPVAPGATGSVTAIFDSTGKLGNFTKSITVVTSLGQSFLHIKGNVIKEQTKPKSPVQIGD